MLAGQVETTKAICYSIFPHGILIIKLPFFLKQLGILVTGFMGCSQRGATGKFKVVLHN